jgi:DNA-binding XRE family transcriptional regulator
MKTITKKPKIKLLENKVKLRLEEIGMSQQELADRVGTNRAHINKIANQNSPAVSLPIAIKIAKELKLPVEQLFVVEQE